MTEKNSAEILSSLFENTRADLTPTSGQLEILAALVIDLLMEVEALRDALRRLSENNSAVRECYRRAYAETALLTHNSGGISTGLEKLVERFYPRGRQGDRVWREKIMLQRLGFSSSEIVEYQTKAMEAETYT